MSRRPVLTKLTSSGSGLVGLSTGSVLRCACRAHLLQLGTPRRRLEPIAQGALDVGGAGRELPVRGLEFLRLAVVAQRLFQLSRRLELLAALVEHVRGRHHRALEGNLVVRPIGVVLQRLAVEPDRGFPVAGLGRGLAPRKRPAGRATRQQGGHRHGHHDTCYTPHRHSVSAN